MTVTGGGLTYQWQMDGVPLSDGAKYSGINTDTLTVNNIQFPNDEGSFNVIVSNGAGSVTSDAATLDIGLVSKLHIERVRAHYSMLLYTLLQWSPSQ